MSEEKRTLTLEQLLRQLAIRANNIIMAGNFSGDDIHEASKVMSLCIHITKATNGDEEHTGPHSQGS